MQLKEYRFHKQISQMLLAKKSNVHQSRISSIENGLVTPRIDEKKNIEIALNLKGSIDWE